MQRLHTLRNKTIVISGASRGIGEAIAFRCALDGAKVALLARSEGTPSHVGLKGTMNEVADRVRDAGGEPLIQRVDVRDRDQVHRAISKVCDVFGQIDAVVNNASVLDMTKDPDPKAFQLLMDVNAKGTLHILESCLPHLTRSDLGHVLSISPPLSTLDHKWLLPHPLYTLSKYSMTMLTLGYSDEVRANTLWPKKLIRTAATKRIERETGIPAYSRGLSPEWFAEVVHGILVSDMTGQSLLDDDIKPVHEDGVDDIFI